MKKLSCLCSIVVAVFCACLFPAPATHAKPTSLTEKIPESKETLVVCTLAKSSRKPATIGRTAVAYKDGEYSYKLWIPQGYEAAPKRRWPCVFIASPGGNANMGPMAKHLKEAGYIVVALQESSNSVSNGVCCSNFAAAHDDVVARLRVAEGQKFVTGMSGGSRVASMFVTMRPGIAGLFQQAAGYGVVPSALPKRNFCIVTSIGTKDFNIVEFPKIAAGISSGVPWAVLISDSGHGWSPAPIAEKAFLQMEARTLMSASSSPDVKTSAQTWLPLQAKIIREMPALVDKIQYADRALKAAAKQGLQNDPALVSLKTELQQWQKAPTAAKEISADDALWRAFAKDVRTIAFRGGSHLKLLEEVAKRHAGTTAGEQAKIFAAGALSPAPMPARLGRLFQFLIYDNTFSAMNDTADSAAVPAPAPVLPCPILVTGSQ